MTRVDLTVFESAQARATCQVHDYELANIGNSGGTAAADASSRVDAAAVDDNCPAAVDAAVYHRTVLLPVQRGRRRCFCLCN